MFYPKFLSRSSSIVLLLIIGLVVLHTVWRFYYPHGINLHNPESFASTLLMQFLLIPIIIYCLYRKSLTSWILFAMVSGILLGYLFSDYLIGFKLLSKIFINLIKTIIAPILLSTLVVGIASHSNIKQVGRMGWKSILYFEIVTTFALIIGLITINISKAGIGIIKPNNLEKLPTATPKSWDEVILHIFPENIAKSIVNGEVLQIVIFSLIFGIALAIIKEDKKKPVLAFMEGLAETMFKFTNIIMYYAPIGVFGAMASTVSHLGLSVIKDLLYLVLTLYISLILFIILILVPILIYYKIPLKQFAQVIAKPVSTAFGTTSSESALPLLMTNLERFGVSRKVVSFVLPMGYSFNLDGTTLYLSLAAIFVAQATGHPLAHDYGQQIVLGLTLMLTSKGVAGVPRASLVILTGVCIMYDMALWPVSAILAVDELMDMARTSVNVIGNAVASCVISQSEHEFDQQKALHYSNIDS